jgi:hypothetical protein
MTVSFGFIVAVIQLAVSTSVTCNQLQNLINFARGEGQPPPGRPPTATGRQEAVNRGGVLSLAAPAAVPPPPNILPPIPFAGNYKCTLTIQLYMSVYCMYILLTSTIINFGYLYIQSSEGAEYVD